MRTEEEKLDQIAGLEEEKKNVSERSLFDNPNHLMIDAQISVLKGEKTADDYAPLDDDTETDEAQVFDASTEAKYWLNGQREENLYGDF